MNVLYWQRKDLFANLERLMKGLGGSLADVLHVRVFVGDSSYIRPLNDVWHKLFAIDSNPTARQVIQGGPHGGGRRRCTRSASSHETPRRNMRWAWTIVSVLGLACGASEVRFEESVTAEPGGKMVVELAYGEVEVRTHAASEVRVVALARGENAGRVEFSLERDGPEVEFTSEIGLGLPLFPSTSDVKCQVWIPEDFELDLETSWGKVHATDIAGDVRIHTSRAAVELSRVRGDVEVKTTRGPIRVEEVAGRVEVRTSRGPIDIRSVSGPVLATTTRSPISVEFQGDPSGELVTTRSPIEVRVPPGASFDLAVKTSRRGSVRVGPELSATREGETGNEHLRINGGGPTLRVRTSRSDVYVGTERSEP